jgi:uncharacterized protein YkwD
MRYDFRFPGVQVLVVLVAASAFAEEKPTAPGPGQAAKPELSRLEQEILDRTNAERKRAGLPAYQVDPTLMKLARDHSATMARLDQLGHELEGKSFDKRIKESGYRHSGSGENVAQGQRTAEQVLDSWMKSPGHKANILNERFTRIGIGFAASKTGAPYYTEVFAAPLD